MTTIHDISGMEFDWFAIDQNLNIALFSTGGYGTIPKIVQSNLDKHTTFSDFIEEELYKKKITGKVWKKYAKIGIYVYDWDHNKSLYKRLETPCISSDEYFTHIPDNAPEYNIDFANTSEILKV